MAKRRANGEGNIRKRVDGRWEARYVDPREPDPFKQYKSITNKSQKVVIEKLKAVLAEIAAGETLLTHENPTVGEWLKTWLKEYRIHDLRDGTYENYERMIRLNIIPLIGDIKLKNLTSMHIQKFYNKLQEPRESGGFDFAAATVIKTKNILSGAMKQAIKNNIIKSNPVAGANPPKVEDTDIKILSAAEQQQFATALQMYNAGNVFAFALATGIRVGELSALTLDDVDRVNKLINIDKSAGRRVDRFTGETGIKVGATKTKNSIRKIPLLPSAEVILDRQEQLIQKMIEEAGDQWNENILIFPTKRGNLHTASNLRKTLQSILKRAGLPHMNVHALRHTYATNALNAGVAPQNVAKLLGHKDGATTLKIYAHYLSSETVAQLETLESHNIKQLGISEREIQRISDASESAQDVSDISKILNDTLMNSKNKSPLKSIESMLDVCVKMSHSPDNLSQEDKDVLLHTFSQYTIARKTLEGQTRDAPKRSSNADGPSLVFG